MSAVPTPSFCPLNCWCWRRCSFLATNENGGRPDLGRFLPVLDLQQRRRQQRVAEVLALIVYLSSTSNGAKTASEICRIRVQASNHIKANLICQRSSILPKDQDGRISPCFILSSSIGFVTCNDRVTHVLIQELQENQKHVTCCNPSQCCKSVLLPSQKLFEDLSHLHPNLPLERMKGCHTPRHTEIALGSHIL